MAQRAPKQSLLDYLWVNFGKLTVPDVKEGTVALQDDVDHIKLNSVSKLKIEGLRLIGKNFKGDAITDVLISGLVGGGEIQGSESNSLIIDVIDNTISGRLKIDNDKDSLVTLVETDKGLKVQFNEDIEELLTIIKNVSEDLTLLKSDVKSNKDALLILNGDKNQEGSVLNQIDNALNWQNV